jgi:hypothetical protein
VIAIVALLAGLLLGAVAMGMMRRQSAPAAAAPSAAAPAAAPAEPMDQKWRVLRHDVNGALSPAMLAADRLSENQDPSVSRAANTILASLQRCVDIMNDPARGAPPPGG